MPTTAFTSEPSTVTVTGTATATAVPDIVRLTIGVSVTQTAVSDAFDAVARLSTALTETLHARACARSGPHHRRAERPSADSLERRRPPGDNRIHGIDSFPSRTAGAGAGSGELPRCRHRGMCIGGWRRDSARRTGVRSRRPQRSGDKSTRIGLDGSRIEGQTVRRPGRQRSGRSPRGARGLRPGSCRCADVSRR